MFSKKTWKVISRILIYLAVLLVVIETLAPFLWMFISSISQGKELLNMPPHWIPEEPTLKRYRSIFLAEQAQQGQQAGVMGRASTFTRGLFNSLLVAVSTMVICLVFGLLASYAIAKLRFRGKRPFLLSIMSMQMLPAIATVIPLFFLIRITGLIDKPLALILTYCGFTVTYIVWVMSGYMGNLPAELEEAARIDGCSHLQALMRITLPLAVPGIVAVGTFAFLQSWNEFLYALQFAHSPAAKTLPVVISEFSDMFGLDYGLFMTGGFIASLPPVILALAFQKYLVRGLAAGAVKG